MKTYPISIKEGARSFAFEVENAYIGPSAIVSLLTDIEGVTNVRPRKIFAKSSDIHVEFKYLGHSYIVWEPFGDNSRYWIGPKDQAEGVGDITKLGAEYGVRSYISRGNVRRLAVCLRPNHIEQRRLS